MKILHLVKTSSGAQWAYRLMRNLVSYGEEVHVAMPLNGKLVQKYREAGIIVHELDFSIRKPFRTISHLRSIVNEVSPDIIHSHFVITTLLMRFALRFYKKPRVFQVPGPLHLEHTFYRLLDVLSAQSDIDYWIPTCKWSYDMYLRSGIDSSRLFLTYYGGDLVNKEYPKGSLRKELGLVNNEIVVGMVAFMYAPKRFLGQRKGLKGHEDLIDAISIIQDKYPNLHLVFIGGAWSGAEHYEREVVQYGLAKVRNIHFLGTRSDVPELYQDIDIAVHPSHSENLGGASESLLLSVPTIATDVGGFPDIVIPEQTGFLVPPKSPEDIAKAVEQVIADYEYAKMLASNGRKMLNESLDIKNTSRDVYNFYRMII